jgi:nitronate monooxygenase
MRPTRRQFLGAAGLGLGAAIARGSAAASTPSPTTQRLLSMFGLTYPIFQAPLGPSGGADLAIAVSSAGAMGTMALWTLPPDEARARVTRVRAATPKSFAVNYVLAFEPRSLPAALEAGAPVVHFSWGMPTQALVATVRQAGAKFGIQVTSAESARAALDLGVDYLVCQGTEAGGHVQATTRLLDALPKVIGEARNVPVLAAGGISNGGDIRRVLRAGAAAAMLGTRFVATRECLAHEKYKDALVRADGAHTVLTVCFDGGWANAPHRVLRNGTFVQWEAAGCPPSGRRPGERDVVMMRPDGSEVRRYSAAAPLRDFKGAPLDCALYAGEGVGRVRDIPPAGDLVRRLWMELDGPEPS